MKAPFIFGSLFASCVAACSLDFVDVPDPELEVTRLDVIIGADLRLGKVVVVAALRPGDLRMGRERAVLDSTLVVLETSLEPTTDADVTGVVFRWFDTVTVSSIEPDVITLRFPKIEEVGAPVGTRMVVRQEAAYLGVGDGWTPGDDLGLVLRPTSVSALHPARTRWTLRVTEWGVDGEPVELFRSASEGEMPDTVMVPGAWLRSVAGDSLAATINLERWYESSTAGGRYEVTTLLLQRLEWPIRVEKR